MAGASADGEVNHWPAFVDVLTTVIMVVTFMLVIMSAAVMVLSQRAIEKAKAQAKEEVLKELAVPMPNRGVGEGGSEGRQTHAISSPADAETGSSIAELGSILKSETIINGKDRLTIRTRETKDMLAVQVKAVERPDTSKGVEVKTADTLLRINFEPTALNIDAGNAAKITEFLKGKVDTKTTYELWSFSPQTSSVSEAQRLAFYRAAMTRNLLIRNGVLPENIYTQVRITDGKSVDGHHVRVVIKP